MHSTNYFNTLIEIADDCPTDAGEAPPVRGQKKSVANLQYEMLEGHPYVFTSDDVVFTTHALRKEIPQAEQRAAREVFFSRGQPCLRASPLTKRYGWGVHSNAEGKIAIYSANSEAYAQFLRDNTVKIFKPTLTSSPIR